MKPPRIKSSASVGNFGKYRDLVIAIALFLILDLGVLVLNFFASTLIETDAARINIASELRMLSQQMTKPLLTMKEELREQVPIQTSWAQLSEASLQFDRNIASLKQPPVQSTGAHLIGKLFSGDERALRTAGVGSSYLAEPAQVLPKADFSGMVELSGRYRGWVCFSATRGLLSQVLMAMGLGSDYSDAGHLDLAGEIANTMIGQAQRHFGDDLEISVPKTFQTTQHGWCQRAGPALCCCRSPGMAMKQCWRFI